MSGSRSYIQIEIENLEKKLKNIGLNYNLDLNLLG